MAIELILGIYTICTVTLVKLWLYTDKCICLWLAWGGFAISGYKHKLSRASTSWLGWRLPIKRWWPENIAVFWHPSPIVIKWSNTYRKNTYQKQILSSPRWVCFLGVLWFVSAAIQWKTVGCRPILRLWLCWCWHFLQISDGLQDLLKFQLFLHGHLNGNPHFFQLQVGWAFNISALVAIQASSLPLNWFLGQLQGTCVTTIIILKACILIIRHWNIDPMFRSHRVIPPTVGTPCPLFAQPGNRVEQDPHTLVLQERKLRPKGGKTSVARYPLRGCMQWTNIYIYWIFQCAWDKSPWFLKYMHCTNMGWGDPYSLAHAPVWTMRMFPKTG